MRLELITQIYEIIGTLAAKQINNGYRKLAGSTQLMAS